MNLETGQHTLQSTLQIKIGPSFYAYIQDLFIIPVAIRIEEFSKTTSDKEKDRTSVKFCDKTTKSQHFKKNYRTSLAKFTRHY